MSDRTAWLVTLPRSERGGCPDLLSQATVAPVHNLANLNAGVGALTQHSAEDQVLALGVVQTGGNDES